MSTYTSNADSRPSSNPRRARRRTFLTVCAAALLSGCSAGPAPGEPGSVEDSDPAVERTLQAAPFQSSAITLMGTASGRPNAWTFERFTATLRLRGDVPTRLDVTIEAASAATSDPALSARLTGADLLNAAAHPRAVFRATTLRELSRSSAGVSYAAGGTLAVAGGSHAVTVPLELSRSGDGAVVRLHTAVNQGQWSDVFKRSATGVFDERLQLAARLVFPATVRR